MISRRARAGAAVALVLVAAGAAAAVEWPLPRTLAGTVSGVVERYLDASLSYRTGAVSLFRGARLSGVVLTGPRGETVSAEAVTASLPWRAVLDLALGRTPPLGTLTVRGASLAVRRGRDGRLVLPIEPPSTAGLFVLRLEDARLRYLDLPFGLDLYVAGIDGSIRLGDRTEGELAGALPEAVGGRWRLSLEPAGDRKVRADLFLLRPDGREAGRAKGIVGWDEAGSIAGDVEASLEADVAARLLRRRLPATGMLRFEGRVEGGARTLALDGEARADRIEAAGAAMTGLVARIRADDRRIVVTRGSAAVFGGRVRIREASIPWADLDAWTAEGRVEGVDAAAATRGRLGAASPAGTLAADFDLRGAPAAPYGAAGTVDVDLRDGSIDAAALERLARLADDPGLRPLPVERLTARVVLDGDGLEADRIRFASPKIGGRGRARVSAGERLSGEMTFLVDRAIVERLAGPIARTLPREGGRVAVPVLLGGTLSDPQAVPNVAVGVVGAAAGVVRGAAETGGKVVGGAAETAVDVLREILP